MKYYSESGALSREQSGSMIGKDEYRPIAGVFGSPGNQMSWWHPEGTEKPGSILLEMGIDEIKLEQIFIAPAGRPELHMVGSSAASREVVVVDDESMDARR
jgi:hypothetical protein